MSDRIKHRFVLREPTRATSEVLSAWDAQRDNINRLQTMGEKVAEDNEFNLESVRVLCPYSGYGTDLFKGCETVFYRVVSGFNLFESSTFRHRQSYLCQSKYIVFHVLRRCLLMSRMQSGKVIPFMEGSTTETALAAVQCKCLRSQVNSYNAHFYS